MHKCNLVVYIWRIGVLVLVGTLGAACQASMIASPSPTLPPPPPLASNPLPFPLPEATPGTAELPDFLLSINAGWRGLIFQDEMKSTLIWAQLDLATLVELDPTLIPEEAELVKRITLFTNGQPQTTRLSYIPPNRSVNIIYLYGEFTLDPGTYEAAVVVQLASGATLGTGGLSPWCRNLSGPVYQPVSTSPRCRKAPSVRKPTNGALLSRRNISPVEGEASA